MDQNTRKLMTIYKVLHVRDDISKLFVLRKEWGWGFGSIEFSVDTSIRRLEDNTKKSKEGLILPYPWYGYVKRS